MLLIAVSKSLFEPVLIGSLVTLKPAYAAGATVPFSYIEATWVPTKKPAPMKVKLIPPVEVAVRPVCHGEDVGLLSKPMPIIWLSMLGK